MSMSRRGPLGETHRVANNVGGTFADPVQYRNTRYALFDGSNQIAVPGGGLPVNDHPDRWNASANYLCNWVNFLDYWGQP